MRRPQLIGRKPRLTADQAEAIRQWAALGTTRAEVARRFGVCPETITKYIRGEIKHYQSRSAA